MQLYATIAQNTVPTSRAVNPTRQPLASLKLALAAGMLVNSLPYAIKFKVNVASFQQREARKFSSFFQR
jgi:hypothetical protein